LSVLLRLPITKRIFVIGAQAADVRQARHLNSGANLHPFTVSDAGMADIGMSAIKRKLWIIEVVGGTFKRGSVRGLARFAESSTKGCKGRPRVRQSDGYFAPYAATKRRRGRQWLLPSPQKIHLLATQ